MSTVAREGTLEGIGQKQFSMKVPDAASESIFGVLAGRLPPQPRRSGRSESIMKIRTFGFSSNLIHLFEMRCGEDWRLGWLEAEKVFLAGSFAGWQEPHAPVRVVPEVNMLETVSSKISARIAEGSAMGEVSQVGCIFALLLAVPAAVADGNITVWLAVDSAQGGSIVQPGSHVLTVGLLNEGEPAGETLLEIEVSKLHQGSVWRTALPADLPGPGSCRNFSLGFEAKDPGLYSIVASVRIGLVQLAGAQLDLGVSVTTDRYQNWRTKIDIANKSHLFLAFYYPWYSNPDTSGAWRHWDPGAEYAATHVPLIGFYDSCSKEVISYHVRTAQSVGLDGFICSWWGPGNYIDDAFSKVLEIGGTAGFNSTIYLEVVQDSNDLYRQLHYLLTRYGAHPAFLKYAQRPVIFIYSRVINTLSVADFGRVFSQLEAQGLPAVYIADSLDARCLDVFDGLHTYSPLNVMDRYPALVDACTARGKVFAATVAPGYDDTIIRRPGLVVERGNGSYYMGAWEMVMVSKPQWVLVTSWNEWHEGSEIEPSLEFGDLYLNLTALYYGLFESGRLTPRMEERTREISEMFAAAEGLIQAADAKGLDTRFMRRDYSIASDSWKRLDYAVTRMYLERILARKDEIREGVVVWAVIVLVCTLAGGASRDRDCVLGKARTPF